MHSTISNATALSLIAAGLYKLDDPAREYDRYVRTHAVLMTWQEVGGATGVLHAYAHAHVSIGGVVSLPDPALKGGEGFGATWQRVKQGGFEHRIDTYYGLGTYGTC